jgi:Transglycosylase SLT domain.|nr:MAG TPA: Soluble lytic transglycosylase B Transglycosylase, LYASE [Caudoviricetes sp.]
MKLSQFEPNINRNIAEGKVIPITDSAAYGANTQESESLNRALGGLQAQLEKMWMKDQNDKVFDASNEYQQRINSLMEDEKNGLYVTLQGKSAESMQDAYQQAESKIREELISKYKLDSDYSHNAFLKQIEPSVTAQLKSIDKRQSAELDKYANNQILLSSQNTTDTILRDPTQCYTALSSLDKTTRAIMVGRGTDGAEIDVKSKNLLNEVGTKLLNEMTATGDYKNGLDTVSKLRAMGVPEDTLKKYEFNFRNLNNTQETKTNLDKFIKDNNIDLFKITDDEIWEKFNTAFPLQVPIGGGSVDDLMRAIAGQESGSTDGEVNYTAENGRTGAYGTYQIMPENWADWCKDAGLPPDAPKTAENQYIVAKAKFNEYVKQFGMQGAMVAWYSGPANAERYINGLDTDVYGRAWTALNGTKDKPEPSIQQYVDEVSGRLGKNSMTPEQVETMNAQRKEAFQSELKMIRNRIHDENTIALDNIQETVLHMKEDGKSDLDIYNYVAGMENMTPNLAHDSRYVNARLGAMNAKNSYLKEEQKEFNERMGLDSKGFMTNESLKKIDALIGVEILSEDDLMNQIEKINELGIPLKEEQYDTLLKHVDMYQNGEGEYGVEIPEEYNGNVILSIAGLDANSYNLTEKKERYLRQSIRRRMAKERAKAKETGSEPPTWKEVIQEEITPSINIGVPTMFGFTTNEDKYSRSYLESKGIYGLTRAKINNKENGWYIRRADGTDVWISEVDLKSVLNDDQTINEI